MPLGLGKLIIAGTMQSLHEGGYRCFDLSIGDFAYKRDFGVEPVPLWDYHLARTWRAKPTFYRERTKTILKTNPRVMKFVRSVKRLAMRPASAHKGA